MNEHPDYYTKATYSDYEFTENLRKMIILEYLKQVKLL